VEDQIKRI